MRRIVEAINHRFAMRDRERTGRAANPSAAVLDSRSAKRAAAGGPRGHDAGKKVLDRRRRALADTGGRALKPHVHPARIQDRDGTAPLLKAFRRSFPFAERIFADNACAGEKVAEASRIVAEIVRKPAGRVGFAAHPRRWVVERVFAWLDRNQRFARDFAKTIASAVASLYAASAMLLLRRLGRC